MMKVSPGWIIALLATVSVSLATMLAPTAQQRSEARGADGYLKIMLGDGRRLFASHFFTKADVYFHSGYYPSIFDRTDESSQKAVTQMHTDEAEHHDGDKGHEAHHDEHDEAHEEGMDFVKEPRDWMERFGRNFTIHDHTHLAEGRQREMLPWLRIAAEMDPQMTQTYVTAAYWLRKEKSQVNEARQFLLEGLRNNPGNDEILFELGSLYCDDMNETDRARNVLNSALNSWFARPDSSKTNNNAIALLNKIAVKLGHVELESGNYEPAIRYLELGKKTSPNPDALQKQIDELRLKSSGNHAP